MVDEQAFRSALAALDKAECPFAKALLGGHAGCGRARRFYLADREGVECASAVALANCDAYLAGLRTAAGPQLAAGDRGGPLPHALALKLQVGGAQGLAAVLGADGTADIAALVAAAVDRPGGLGALAYPAIVDAVAAFTPRRRR